MVLHASKYIAFLLLVSGIVVQSFLGVSLASAAGPCNGFGKIEVGIPGFVNPGTCISDLIQDNGGSGFTNFIGALINVVTAVVIVVGLGAIIFSGYLYMTAGGDASRIGRAKTFITTALISILVALTAWLILHTISGQFTPTQDPTLHFNSPAGS